MACMLAFGRVSSAASCARMSPTSLLVAARLEIRYPHAVFGERAGLVRAHHVDPGQPFDRGQLVDEALPAAQPDHPDGERDRCHQHQALGHHRHQGADHPQHRLAPSRIGGEQLRVDDQQAGREQQVGDELQDLVDAAAQFGVDQRELAGLLGELGGVGLPADLGGPVRTAAGDDEAARHHRVAGIFRHRVGLTGEQGLVDLEVGLLDDLAVDDDLVAGPEFDDVVEHDLAGSTALVPDCLRTKVSPARRWPACPASASRAAPG